MECEFSNIEEDNEISNISPASSNPMSSESSQSIILNSPIPTPNDLFLSNGKKFTENGLRGVDEIPMKFRHIFSMYSSFNAFQSKVMDDILYDDKPVVISAPTGSGKTVVFELAIVNLLMKLFTIRYKGDFMIVYMAPIKALCSERLRDWQCKFLPVGLKCQEVTGDSDNTSLADLSTYNIVITTPEKWDSLTRSWKDNKRLFQNIKLFLLDEIHLLNDEQRGPVLEAVVTRMKIIQENTFSTNQEAEKSTNIQSSIRFVAVSATIPNIDDVALWLGGPEKPAQYFSVGEEFRPVTLRKLVMGYHCAQLCSQFRFEMQLTYKLRQLLLQYSEGKPSLIFCSTRKGVMQTADTLMKEITFHFNEEQKIKLLAAMDNIKENPVKRCLAAGVGCHHAGLDSNDRHVIEDLFRSGGLPVLITTSTLAMGVNLPAHLVIIKSTQQYTGSGYQEYSSNQVLQMIGRAGRPQYDTHATAIIMTHEDKIKKYEKLVKGTDILESNLHHHLAEHLNAEVVLSTIQEKVVAINWIRSTFLYVRALRSPSHYGISSNLTKMGIESKLQEMCVKEMNALANTGLVNMDDINICPTGIGKLMAQHYMRFETMKVFTNINGKEKLNEMLDVVTRCHEYADCKLRVNEKRTLNFLNKSIRFPFKGLIKTSQMKLSCLIQAMFGGLVIPEPSLQQEAVQAIRSGIRITKCLKRYLSLQDKYQSLLSATILCKCFQSNLWEDSPFVSRQLAGIGVVLSQLLVSAGKVSFTSIAESNPRDLERIINRAPPMGNRLQCAARYMPKYTLNLSENIQQSLSNINICVKLLNYDDIKNLSTPGPNHNLIIIAGDSNNKLLLYKRFPDSMLINYKGVYTWQVNIPTDQIQKIFIHLVSENWVGMDVQTSITTKGLYIKENYIPLDIPEVKQEKTVTPNQFPGSHKQVKKNKDKKKNPKSSPMHQLSRTSTKIIKGPDKSLPINLQNKIQIDLDKYFFKPQKNNRLTLKPVDSQDTTDKLTPNLSYNQNEKDTADNTFNNNFPTDTVAIPDLVQSNKNFENTNTHIILQESDCEKQNRSISYQREGNLHPLEKLCSPDKNTETCSSSSQFRTNIKSLTKAYITKDNTENDKKTKLNKQIPNIEKFIAEESKTSTHEKTNKVFIQSVVRKYFFQIQEPSNEDAGLSNKIELRQQFDCTPKKELYPTGKDKRKSDCEKENEDITINNICQESISETNPKKIRQKCEKEHLFTTSLEQNLKNKNETNVEKTKTSYLQDENLLATANMLVGNTTPTAEKKTTETVVMTKSEYGQKNMTFHGSERQLFNEENKTDQKKCPHSVEKMENIAIRQNKETSKQNYDLKYTCINNIFQKKKEKAYFSPKRNQNAALLNKEEKPLSKQQLKTSSFETCLEKNKECLNTQPIEVGDLNSQEQSHYNFCHNSTLKEGTIFQNTNCARFYPIFIKDSNHIKTECGVTKRSNINIQQMNPPDIYNKSPKIKATFNLGIEDLIKMDNESINEKPNTKTNQQHPLIPISKPKRDLTNPITRLLYGNKYQHIPIENIDDVPKKQSSLFPPIKQSPMPESLLFFHNSSQTLAKSERHFREPPEESMVPIISQNNPDNFSLHHSRIFNTHKTKCTLDPFEFLTNLESSQN